MRLFSSETYVDLNLEDSEILYYPNFYDEVKADKLKELLLNKVPWQQDTIRVFGKDYLQPRLTAFYGNNGKALHYSNITMVPDEFSSDLLKIKDKIESCTKEKFTSCLLNLYRDGKDSNGWHADNEKELGVNPSIASLSFGETRRFHLKHKTKSLKHRIELEHGSLLVMKGTTQHYWQHQISKTKRKIGERINLTFRNIK